MRVLVTGAYGFIGMHIVAGLRAAGHRVVGCGRDVKAGERRIPGIEWIACDMVRDTTIDAWTPRLDGIGAVINCAGILQGRRSGETAAVHRDGPAALFDACAKAGVRRVIQISALGIEEPADTAFAITKRAGDEHLMALDLDWVVLRPSLVYGPGSYGGTSLLRGLAGLPWVIPLPMGGRQRFQPLHMRDLARAVRRLIEPDAPARVLLRPVGPEPMTLREIVLGLRRWMGFGRARVVAVPRLLIRVVAALGDLFRVFGGRGPLNSTAMRQMEADNTADPAPFVAAVGFTPARFDDALAAEPSHVQDRWHARLYFLRPVLRSLVGLTCIAFGWYIHRSMTEKNYVTLHDSAPSSLLSNLAWVLPISIIVLGILIMMGWRVRLIATIIIAVAILLVAAMTFVLGAPALLVLIPIVAPLVAATLVTAAIEGER